MKIALITIKLNTLNKGSIIFIIILKLLYTPASIVNKTEDKSGKKINIL